MNILYVGLLIISLASIYGFDNPMYLNNIILHTKNDSLYAITLDDNGDIFPKYIVNFSSISTLNISKCQYKFVPEELSTFKKLEELNVTNCYQLDYSSLFSKLINCVNLRRLRLQSDSIKDIPRGISNLTSVIVMDISNNQIEQLPQELFEIKTLKYILLSGNNIKGISLFNDSNSTVHQIYLDDNKLSQIPKGLDHFKSIYLLNLDNNENLPLNDICSLVKELPNLKVIYIRNIKKAQNDPLPSNISNLKSLKRVIINRAQFSNEQLLFMEKNDIKVNNY